VRLLRTARRSTGHDTGIFFILSKFVHMSAARNIEHFELGSYPQVQITGDCEICLGNMEQVTG
jgi:hypothetical protein